MNHQTSAVAVGIEAPPVVKARDRLRSIVGGSIGNLIEWYDWLVYASFSLFFAKSFFPNGNQTAQLLNTSAIFVVGYLMRPIGGLLMGLYADRKGRKAALTLSVLLMCVGYVTLQGGQLMAVIVLLLLQQVFLTPKQLDDWGWRIPFALGACFAVVAFYLRRALRETSAFDRVLVLLVRHGLHLCVADSLHVYAGDSFPAKLRSCRPV